jgi:glycerol-3-phosphate acyltransferase PlsY
MTPRILLPILIAFEALACAWILASSISVQWDADGISRGIGAVYAINAVLAFLLFVLPAFTLWYQNKYTSLALILTLIPLVPMITVIEPVITSSQWYISWFVWRQAPWDR